MPTPRPLRAFALAAFIAAALFAAAWRHSPAAAINSARTGASADATLAHGSPMPSGGGHAAVKSGDPKQTLAASACAQPPADMISLYRAEGDAADTLNANNGTVVGGSFTNGKVGQGYLSNSFGQHIFVPASASTDIGSGGSFTVEAWVNPSNVGTVPGTIVRWQPPQGQGGVKGVHFLRNANAGFSGPHYVADIKDVNGISHSISTSNNQGSYGAFSHIALTYSNATGEAIIYVNGAAVKTENIGSFIPKTDGALHIGGAHNSDSPFSGIIDETAIYNRALSQSEIQAIFDAGSAGKCTPGCVASPSHQISWWRGENNADDSQGTNNGSLQNGLGFATGQVGQAFNFTAGNQSVQVPDSSSLDIGSQVTLEAWIAPSQVGTGDGSGATTTIISKEGPAPNNLGGYSLMYRSDGRVMFRTCRGSQFGPFCIEATAFPDPLLPLNSFSHVAGTYDGQTARIYVNGTLFNQAAYDSPQPIALNDSALTIGGTNFFGKIDEPSVYNRALSQTEIQTIFNAGSSGKCGAAALQIAPTTANVNTGGTVNFSAVSGAAPYAFSIATNNSGGSINSSTGVYTAGNSVGTDTVRVTDANSATAEATVNVNAPCVSGQKTWDGGGATNNWSEGANWTCDAVPVAGETVIFNGTSTKDATIDTALTLGNLQINSGYTGTITQGAASAVAFNAGGLTSFYTQTSGTFVCGGAAVSFNGTQFALNGGRFNCAASDISALGTSFALNGGTFDMPSGAFTLGDQNGSTSINRASGATLNHSNGTMLLRQSNLTFNGAAQDVNNVTVNPSNNGVSGTMRVLGALNLQQGLLSSGNPAGAVEVLGSMTVAATYGSSIFGVGPAQLNISRTANTPSPRAITLPAGLPTAFNPFTLNDASATVNTSGAGSITFTNVNLQAGAIETGGVEIIFSSGGQTSFYTQSGGTFTAGGGNLSFNGTLFNLSGGTFAASTGTTTFNGSNLTQTGGAFNANGGTVQLVGGTTNFDVTASINLNNLTVATNHFSGLTLGGGDRVNVAGNLNLTDGVLSNDANVVDVQGGVTVANTFDGGAASIRFSGAANQTFTNNGGANPTGAWTIDKSGGTVRAASSLILFPSQSLNVTSGTLYLNDGSNLTTGALTVGTGGRLVNESATTITLGGNVTNNGVIDLQGGGAACPEADTILIRSSANGTRRNWSGSGRYRLVDVDVKDMSRSTGSQNTPITVFNGTDSGNNLNWTFDANCPATLSITPSSVGVQTGQTQTFTAGGGFAPYTFSIPTNNSGGSITPTPGQPTKADYTAGTTAGVNDTVRVTDFFGATADANVNTFAAPSKLAFVTQPSNTTAGQAISPAIQVAVQDQFGNTITNSSAPVTISISNNPNGGSLSGTLTRNAVNGIATFDNLSINRAGEGYTLQAVSNALTAATSGGFNIAPGTPSQLAFVVQPTDASVNETITPAVQVAVQDEFENLVTGATNPITLQLLAVQEATLSGTLTRNASGGIAVFDDLKVDRANPASNGHRLGAFSPNLRSGVSGEFNVVGPFSLAFTVEPPDTGTHALSPITPPVQVSILNQFGDVVTTATNAITVSFGGFSSGATLSGTLTRNAVGGIATFDDLVINETGIFNLKAVSGTLPEDFSNSFSVASPFLVANTNDSGPGSLRQAIINTNRDSARDTITFNIPGDGPFTITPSSRLPSIAFTAIIDGTSQPNSNGRLLIELNGANAGADASGLVIIGGESTIKGLVINRFKGHGIALLGTGRNTIQGNYIGTNAAGDAAQPNNGDGIHILNSPDNLIGGTDASMRNVISGNGSGGVRIQSSASANNLVQGNFIGTNAAGTSALANLRGVFISSAPNNTVGGSAPTAGNIISGNASDGVRIQGRGANSNIVINNFIGTDVSGAAPLPNEDGVHINGGLNNIIGDGVLDRIAFNRRHGVNVLNGTGNGTGNAVRRISIHSNGGQGINLFPDGVTPNDPQDADEGSNNLQNFPVVTSAVTSNNSTTIAGTLNSAPGQRYWIQFYASPSCDASGHGEGTTFVGDLFDVTTDAGGIAGFTSNLSTQLSAGQFVTATATDAQGNTSEFSACRAVALTHVSISGRLKEASGAGIGNVAVNRQGTRQSVVSDSSGFYIFRNLPAGGTYTLVPQTRVATFSPASLTFTNVTDNQAGQDFTGTLKPLIQGKIQSALGGSTFALSGVTVNLSGAATRSAITDENGNYTFTNISQGSYTVTPTRQNFAFSPASASLSLASTTQTANFTATLSPPLDGRVLITRHGTVSAMNADASGFVNIAESAGGRFTPFGQAVFSRDGGRVAVAGAVRLDNNAPTTSSPARIFVTNFDGSARQMFSSSNSHSFSDVEPAFSPDGTMIAFVRKSGTAFSTPSNSPQTVRLVNLSTLAETLLYSSPNNTALTDPSWSLDGVSIVFTQKAPGGNGQILSVNVSALAATTLASANNNFRPIFSPDGTKIAFLRNSNPTSTDGQIMTMNADGTSQTSVDSQTIYRDVAWSPDGQRLSFIRNTSPNYGVMSANGTNRFDLGIFTFNEPAIFWGAAFAPVTPTGTTPVTTTAGATSVTFSGVSAAGQTTVVPIPPNSAGTAPNGFVLGNQAYEITTTATVTPPITVCFNVPASAAATQAAFNQLSILHNEDGTLVDRTVSRNFSTRTICASVTSLSPFVLAQQVDAGLPRVTGIVVDGSGNPLASVAVNLTGAETRTTQTDSDGSFSFVNLTAGGNYNVQPKQVGYLFTEYSQDFVNLSGEQTIVFEGTASAFQIGGRVTDAEGNAVSGVQVDLDGATQATRTTDADGNYSFNNLPADGFYAVTPSRAGSSFAPPLNIVESLTGNATEVDFVEGAATQPLAGIRGRVTLAANGAPVAGVTINLTGAATGSTATDAEGFYAFDALAAGAYTITPARARFSFNAPSRDVTLADVDVEGINFAAASTLTNPQPASGTVLISELRLSGETPTDEYVELYNDTDSPVDISGYQLDAIAGLTVTVPTGTTLPARSHYLVAHASGYTLSSYAAPDQTYAFDLPAGTGIALLNASGVVIDAVGFGTTPQSHVEGSALAVPTGAVQYAYARKAFTGYPADAGDNASDFMLVAVEPGNLTGAQALLGTPGPENLASPVFRTGEMGGTLLDSGVSPSQPPNRVRSFTSDPTNNSRFGTLSIRRTITNNTGAPVTRLRFRVVQVTTFPADAGTADLRVRSSTNVSNITVTPGGNAGCPPAPDPCTLNVVGLTLEEPPSQIAGGGNNSSLRADSVSPTQPSGIERDYVNPFKPSAASDPVPLSAPLAPGGRLHVNFLLGIQSTGRFKFYITIEALP